LAQMFALFACGCRKQRQAQDPDRKNQFHDSVAANRWTVEAATIQAP
jgi:predicted outer membrane protein